MVTVTVSEDITGAASAVWAAMGDFADVKVDGRRITSFETKGHGVGMIRILGTAGGDVVQRLDHHDAKAMTYTYSIVRGDVALPWSGYSGTLKVSDKGNGTCNVHWVGTFQAEREAEADASKRLEQIYRDTIDRARKAVGG